MNGSSSNTDGSKVANIGFWPKAILPRIVELAQGIVTSLQALVSGDADAAAVDFANAAGADNVADHIMAEIARRLIVTLDKADQGNVVFSPTAPEDKTKAWWQTDPVTGIPIGRPKTWDADADQWVEIVSDAEAYSPPRKRYLKERVLAGASTVNITFADMLTSNYSVFLSFTTQNADGTWATPPVSYPTAFGYLITNKTNTTLTVAFYAVPVGGMTIEGCIEENV